MRGRGEGEREAEEEMGEKRNEREEDQRRGEWKREEREEKGQVRKRPSKCRSMVIIHLHVGRSDAVLLVTAVQLTNMRSSDQNHSL